MGQQEHDSLKYEEIGDPLEISSKYQTGNQDNWPSGHLIVVVIDPALGHFASSHQFIVIVFQIWVAIASILIAPDLRVNFWKTCFPEI